MGSFLAGPVVGPCQPEARSDDTARSERRRLQAEAPPDTIACGPRARLKCLRLFSNFGGYIAGMPGAGPIPTTTSCFVFSMASLSPLLHRCAVAQVRQHTFSTTDWLRSWARMLIRRRSGGRGGAGILQRTSSCQTGQWCWIVVRANAVTDNAAISACEECQQFELSFTSPSSLK